MTKNINKLSTEAADMSYIIEEVSPTTPGTDHLPAGKGRVRVLNSFAGPAPKQSESRLATRYGG